MPNFAQQLFGLSKRYAGGEKPSGGGGLFGALAYKLSQNPTFQQKWGSQQQTGGIKPPVAAPTQPPLMNANMGQAQPFGGGSGIFGQQTDPYGYMNPQVGDFLKKLGLNTTGRFKGFGR